MHKQPFFKRTPVKIALLTLLFGIIIVIRLIPLTIVLVMDQTLEEAEANCEKALKHVVCDAVFVRHDIGTRALVQKRVDHMRELRSA